MDIITDINEMMNIDEGMVYMVFNRNPTTTRIRYASVLGMIGV